MTRFYFHLVIGFVVLWILSGLTCGGCATPPRSIPTPTASLSGSTDAGTETATDSGSTTDAPRGDAPRGDACAALACGVVDGKLACVEITCAEAEEEAEALEVKRAADELGEMGMKRF